MKLLELKNFFENFFGEELINKARAKDEHMPNGLQWQGSKEVKKVVFSVSASEELFKKAAEKKAQAVIVHHGLPKDIPYNLYSSTLQKRLKILVQNNISLFGFHFLLDHHPEIGHNALIIKRLGAKKTQPLFDEWGWVGEFARPQRTSTIKKKCQHIFNYPVAQFGYVRNLVSKIGVVSGRGVPFGATKFELEEKGIELYITGEISEWNPAEFLEMGVTYLACGHYATETLGIKELMNIIANKFPNLQKEFIDVPSKL